MNLPKCFVIDTNCLIYDPNAIEVLMNDVNEVYIHTAVIQELDNLKHHYDIGRDCREAIRNIDKLHIEKHPRFHIVQRSDWSDLRLNHLDKGKNDHNIIALAYNLAQDDKNDVKLISKDVVVRILARDLSIIVEDYVSESIKIDDTNLKEVEVPYGIIDKWMDGYVFELPDMSGFIENSGVICWSDWNGNLSPDPNTIWKQNFVAIKKSDRFHIIPNDISMMGLTPYMMNGSKNWEQYIAMAQLLDNGIRCVFLIGGTGSGKTMLALASALEQRKKFRNIVITRPMISLENEDKIGFLPGGIDEKMGPWIKPIYRTISQISTINDDNKKIIERVKETNKLEIQPLDYVRGLTFVKDVLVCDEAQNMSQHSIRTLITRAGEGTKMIFTGDLAQIDVIKKINAETSGLAYASVKMSDQKMIATTHFKNTVRSELACLAERLLK